MRSERRGRARAAGVALFTQRQQDDVVVRLAARKRDAAVLMDRREKHAVGGGEMRDLLARTAIDRNAKEVLSFRWLKVDEQLQEQLTFPIDKVVAEKLVSTSNE